MRILPLPGLQTHRLPGANSKNFLVPGANGMSSFSPAGPGEGTGRVCPSSRAERSPGLFCERQDLALLKILSFTPSEWQCIATQGT